MGFLTRCENSDESRSRFSALPFKLGTRRGNSGGGPSREPLASERGVDVYAGCSRVERGYPRLEVFSSMHCMLVNSVAFI